MAGVISVLSEFQMLSGLAISTQKSCFFQAGLSAAEIASLSPHRGSTEGNHQCCFGNGNLKNLVVWNKTCLMRLLRMLLFKQDSVWAGWIHQSVIKDRNF
ncbi:hypothetical protein F2Q69_00013802 [Brassica cretica]|uniref:Uncharacterized protein n=1 Tax=Brassica cretica TaxID=69181 RepID=A0A8S9QYA1_BRACR|nr:hypothetical protein F2Q69_00013802 [Brassica cretica]